MKYRSIDKIEIDAFQWGSDEAPEWIKAHCENAGNCLIIKQPEVNNDLVWGTEIVARGDFVVLTKGGSFQVFKAEQFYRRFVIRTRD